MPDFGASTPLERGKGNSKGKMQIRFGINDKKSTRNS
jgi:hypothetical protein